MYRWTAQLENLRLTSKPANTAEAVKLGISQKQSSRAKDMIKYAAIASFSPTLPVTKPSSTLPNVMPSQNPVATNPFDQS